MPHEMFFRIMITFVKEMLHLSNNKQACGVCFSAGMLTMSAYL